MDGHITLGWPALSRGTVPAGHLRALYVLRSCARQQHAPLGPWGFDQGQAALRPIAIAGRMACRLGLKVIGRHIPWLLSLLVAIKPTPGFLAFRWLWPGEDLINLRDEWLLPTQLWVQFTAGKV